MFCQKCANKLLDGAKFCNKCGHPVSGHAGEKSANTSDLILPASTLRRLSNYIIDSAVAYILLVVCTLPGSLFSDTGAMVMAITGIVLFFGHQLICEAIW